VHRRNAKGDPQEDIERKRDGNQIIYLFLLFIITSNNINQLETHKFDYLPSDLQLKKTSLIKILLNAD
jgi:hypothetical protein